MSSASVDRKSPRAKSKRKSVGQSITGDAATAATAAADLKTVTNTETSTNNKKLRPNSQSQALVWSMNLLPPPLPVVTSGERRRPHVLIAVSGSVATVKIYEITERLMSWCDVRVITTKSAQQFFDLSKFYSGSEPLTSAAASAAPLLSSVPIYTDEMEYEAWTKMGDPVLHIELRKWADCLLVAPLSANTLAKLAAGMSDNLLTCVARAWDVSTPAAPAPAPGAAGAGGTGSGSGSGLVSLRYPFVVAPAMNTLMWSHPFTAQHLLTLRSQLRVTVIDPISKKLACNDIGTGALATPTAIVEAVRQQLAITHAPELIVPEQLPTLTTPHTTATATATPATAVAAPAAPAPLAPTTK